MSHKILLFVCVFGCQIQIATAQQTFVDFTNQDKYKKALSHFYDRHYNAAQSLFDDYLLSSNDEQNLNALAHYYSALSGIYLFQSDAENRIKQFVAEYPNHPKALQAYFDLGNFYYREKNYAKAIQYYEMTDKAVLSKASLEDYKFRIGYAYFTRKAFEEALPYFNDLKINDNEYRQAAHYYAGYINYELGDYGQALADLEKAERNDAYTASVAEMKANIYYQIGRYQDVIDYAEQMTAKKPANMYLIVGDAYYTLGQYEKAAEYFDDFRKRTTSVSDRGVLFRMGYAAFKQGENTEAVKMFEAVGIQQDTLTQYSTYYLGKLYQEAGNERFAINAYFQSKSFEFDKDIAEASHWQLCALLIATGAYADAIKEIRLFLEKYPQSSQSISAKETLSQAYLNTNAYDLAINFIESLNNLTPKLKEAYQKVTYFKGAALFNQGKFYEAVQSFEKSVENPVSEPIAGQAFFWMGEAYATGKKYDRALDAYLKAINKTVSTNDWYQALLYGTAYAYYNTKQFNKALLYFNKYINEGQQMPYFEDALLRSADCYYVTKRYDQAINQYGKIKGTDDQDYIYFQLGVVNGLQDNNKNALKNYDRVINDFQSSKFYDNALFQKALLTFEAGDYAKAVEQFKEMLQKVPQSNLVPFALSKRAIAYFNLSQYELALVDYRNILQNYMSHPTANGALLGLQEIYAIQNIEGDFDEFLLAYKKANPNDRDVSNIEYDAAKSLYFNQSYEKAGLAFKNFIENYPDNAKVAEARYYMADAYYRKGAYNEALPIFNEVIASSNSIFRKRAVQKVADIELNNANYDKAEAFYKQLLKLAENPRDQYNAWSGLLTIAEQRNAYDEIINYSDLIINKGNVNTKALTEAYVSKGLAYFNQGKYDLALKPFELAIATAEDENAAEAKYLIALMDYNNAQYQESLNTLFELNETFSAFEEWLGKSFLLIADNYFALEEVFQAKATLNSIIENATSTLLVDEARLRLDFINNEEQQQDSINNAVDSIKILQEADTLIISNDTIKD